jgi:hypothetical protein
MLTIHLLGCDLEGSLKLLAKSCPLLLRYRPELIAQRTDRRSWYGDGRELLDTEALDQLIGKCADRRQPNDECDGEGCYERSARFSEIAHGTLLSRFRGTNWQGDG